MATTSPSSAPEPRPPAGPTRPGDRTPNRDRDRGQLSPTAALVAVGTIGMALSLYATVFTGVVPVPDRNVAEPTLERVSDTVVAAGVADPARLERAGTAGPDGYRLQVSLRWGSQRWAVGPTPPRTGVETAGRRVGVRTGPGSVRSGRLRVVVWR